MVLSLSAPLPLFSMLLINVYVVVIPPQVRFEVVPVMDTRKLRLIFPFPDMSSRYKAKVTL
jgi:hypothetical protein